MSVRVVYFIFLRLSVCSMNEWPSQGSMRKANSLSECRLLRVRRSGSRRRSLGKRVVSSGRRRVISDRRARMRPSCSCSTAHISEMPERSEEHIGCLCEYLIYHIQTVLLFYHKTYHSSAAFVT